ncbi:hypothetical protein LJK88_16215 [Paenibacillus sp. P26]|nr:hypothetical protein LJK88_16215 [Paenibacillus sp. P26]
MRLGAEDYILKLSMQPDSLLEILLKAKTQVEKEKQRKEERIHFESVFRANKQVIKNGLYKKLMNGSIAFADFEREAAIMQVQPDFSSYLVIYGTIDDFYHAPAKSRMRDSHLLSSSFLNILKEGLADLAKAEFAELDEGEYLILLDASVREASSPAVLTEPLQRMNHSLKRYLNITVTFAVSGRTGGLKGVPALHSRAKQASGHRFYRGRRRLFMRTGCRSSPTGKLFSDWRRNNCWWTISRPETRRGQGRPSADSFRRLRKAGSIIRYGSKRRC